MELETLGIDDSVSAVFPPTELIERLQESQVETIVLENSRDDIGALDGVVTFAYREAFLETNWVHSIQAGVDRFPFERFLAEDVRLTNSRGIHGDAIGETVASYCLAFARRLHEHVRNQTHKEWAQPDWDEAWTIAGEKACVVGLGGLGRGIVDRLTGLGLDVVGVRRTPTPEPGVDTVYTPARLDEAVSDARFVIFSVPLTEETRGMVDKSVLRSIPDDAYLVNVSRGDVVDQDTLVAALQNETIAGAALDVFETEPLPADSPLWEMDDVIVSPHCGAFTREYVDHAASLVRESITRINEGDDPVNRVC
jgi:D-2-hydroxyacid dehydrogenase (NADP+)